MSNFKVGDWIKIGDAIQQITAINPENDYNITCDMVETTDDYVSIESIELWRPKEGEHVWFWDKCTPHRPTLREFGDTKKADDGQWYYTDSEQNPYECCEPFVYDKPSVFKG